MSPEIDSLVDKDDNIFDSQPRGDHANHVPETELEEHAQILVLNVPPSFEPELAKLSGLAIRRSLRDGFECAFVLAFVTRQDEVDGLAAEIAKAAIDDLVLWFAYPKGTSKRFKSEMNRDRGWQILGDLGFEPVRNIAIDEDWTALRFRRVEFIPDLEANSAPPPERARKSTPV